MHRTLLALAVITSLSACAPPAAPSSVETGLETARPIASLDQMEIEQACEGWASYAEGRLASLDGPMGIACAIRAAQNSGDRASCERAYAACLVDAPPLDATCTTGAHPVPDCESDVTVARYEDCMTRAVDQLAALDVDCSLAGDPDAIHARLAGWGAPTGCEALNTRACAPFAPRLPDDSFQRGAKGGHCEGVICRCAVLALVLATAAGARAQSMDVLVGIDAGDPVAEATLRELEQRGLHARIDEPQATTGADGARALRVAALAMGARAVVWIEARETEISVRALRAEDGEQGASVISAEDVRAEPRLAALVAGALLEEILSRSHASSEPAAALAAPPPIPVDVAPIAPRPPLPSAHAYATFSADAWARFDPLIGGGMSMRASSGTEWPDGLRIGAQFRIVPGTDSMHVDLQVVQRVAMAFLAGAEIVGRFPVLGHALLVGASAAVGPAQRIDATGQEIWDVLVLAGGLVGLAFPIGLSTEMGVHLGLDVRFEPSRNVAPCPSIGVRWDWR